MNIKSTMIPVVDRTDMINAGNYDVIDIGFIHQNGRSPLPRPHMLLYPGDAQMFTTAGLEVIHLGMRITSEEAKFEIARRGLRPAIYEELLAFGAEKPDMQREFLIVALGTIVHLSQGWCDTNQWYPFLDCYEGKRRLAMNASTWGESARYLVTNS